MFNPTHFPELYLLHSCSYGIIGTEVNSSIISLTLHKIEITSQFLFIYVSQYVRMYVAIPLLEMVQGISLHGNINQRSLTCCYRCCYWLASQLSFVCVSACILWQPGRARTWFIHLTCASRLTLSRSCLAFTLQGLRGKRDCCNPQPLTPMSPPKPNNVATVRVVCELCCTCECVCALCVCNCAHHGQPRLSL